MRIENPREADVPPAAPGGLRSQWWTYLLAVAVTTATLGVRLSFASWFGDRPVLILFVLPIFLSAYVGGLGPGLIATAVIALSTSYFLMPPVYSFAMERSVDSVQWLILVVSGVLISVLTESLHAARRAGQDTGVTGRSLAAERKVQGGFALALAFLVAIGGVSVLSVNRLREDTGWATHTEEVISSLRLLLSTVTDAETGVRGFFITGEDEFLEPYRGTREVIDNELKDLRRLTADNSLQQHQLDLLAPLITERLKVAEENIARRRLQEQTTAEASEAISRGKSLHDRIRALIAEMEATEKGLLRVREDRAKRVGTVTRSVILGGGILSFVFVALALYVMNQEFAVRRRTEAVLRETHDLLETRVRHRTAELEQTNEALRHSERRFRALIEHSGDGIALIDAANNILYLSPSVTSVEGYTPDELIGRNGIENTHPDDLPVVQEVVAKLIASPGQPVPVLWRRRHKNGRWLWLEGVATNLLNDPAVGAIVTNYRDITERKAAEAALQASEGRYRTLFEYAPDGIVIANQLSYYLDANASMCRMLGYTRDEFIGLHASDIVVPSEIAHIGPALSMLQTKSDYQREWQFRRKDGTIFPADVIATRMPDGNLLAVIRDITERKRTELALREGEEYFRFLDDLAEATRTEADSAQIMMVTARMLGEHLHASRCAYADVEPDGERFIILHDYTDGCASAVGRYQLSLFGPRAVTTLNRGQTLIIRNVAAELLPGEGADMFSAIGIQAIINCPLLKEGRLHAMMAVHQATPREWKPGEIAIVQDVVERCWSTIGRRAAEEKINQLNVTLEGRVIERTAQLAAANEELEAFTYSVSHDLRAPLRAVDGFSRIVLEDYGPALPPEGGRYLQNIRRGAQQMGNLIDDLLAFSRLSRRPLGRQAVDMAGVAREALAGLGSLREGRQIEIRQAELPAGEGDPALLKQVWINLLSNALKYTGKRPAAVIEIGSLQEQGRTVYFVRDNGTGFDMQYAHKLFGVFQRLHRAEEFEGTGVGLAIVQRIIQRHGGRVWAEGAVDRGATFYFTVQGETKS